MQNLKPQQTIIEIARRGLVTLTYSSHDAEHNNAVALYAFLKHRS